MKKLIKIVFVIVFLVMLTILVFKIFKKKGDEQYNVKDMLSIHKLIHERDEVLRMHHAYIKGLSKLKFKITQIGNKISSKIIARNLGKVGNEYSKNKLWKLALANFKTGLSIFPEDADLNYQIGVVYANLGMVYFGEVKKYWKKAEKFYLRALQFNSKYAKSYYAIARLYLAYYEKGVKKTLISKALSYSSTYVNMMTSDTNGYFLKAKLLYILDQKEEALRNYNIILGLLKNEKSVQYKNALKLIKTIKSEINE